jgi:serine/threonine protein kinase
MSSSDDEKVDTPFFPLLIIPKYKFIPDTFITIEGSGTSVHNSFYTVNPQLSENIVAKKIERLQEIGIPNYSVLGNLSGGRSGDDLFIIERNDQKTILKCSVKMELKNEIKNTLRCHELWNILKQNELKTNNYIQNIHPIIQVDVYYNPKYSLRIGENIYPCYYFMEYLDRKIYKSLTDCLRNAIVSENYSLVRIALQNLVYTICILKTYGYSYCDLHPDNVFVYSKEDENYGNVKIIDFGLVQTDYMPCEKSRYTTLKFKEASPNFSYSMKTIFSLISQQPDTNLSGNFDSDIAMLVTTLKLISPDKDLNKLYDYAYVYYAISNNIKVLDKKSRIQQLLDEFYIHYRNILQNIK